MRTTLLAACLALLAGCTPPSIEPFFQQGDLLLDDALPGLWRNANSGDLIQFARAGTAYELRYAPRVGVPARFRGGLFALEGLRYLDVSPLERPMRMNGLLDLTHVPVHILFRIERAGDRLRLAMLDSDWMEAKLGETVCPLRHRWVDGLPVLVAATTELRSFLLRHGAEAAAFENWSEWTRMTDTGFIPGPTLE